MYCSGKFVLPPTNPLPCFGLEVLAWCHIAIINKIVEHGRVVVFVIVVVVNALSPSLSLKYRGKESELQPSNTNYRNGGCVLQHLEMYLCISYVHMIHILLET